MNCIWVEKLSSLIDGELPIDEARAVERHVVGCLECQEARADFLNLRSQIMTFDPALDHSASNQALASILSRSGVPQNVKQPRTWTLGLGALRFNPAFAAVVVLIVAAVMGLVIYRRVSQPLPVNQPSPSDSLAEGKRAPRGASRTGPESSQQQPARTTNGPAKDSAGKGPKPKARPANVPKLPVIPDDRISPTANQAIAENSTEPDNATFSSARSIDAQNLTAHHLEQSELLLVAFRNVRTDAEDEHAEVAYEKQRAQRLVYQNIMLRQEADASGDVQVSTLLESLEPILLDIANLPNEPHQRDVKAIKDRLQRKNLVALLQVNSTALARAND
jgi:Putative zinc-finger